MNNRERELRRQLREAKRQLDQAQSEYANAVFTDDDEREPDWQRADRLTEVIDEWSEKVGRLEEQVYSNFGNRVKPQRRESKRGRQSAPANPGFDRMPKDFHTWFKNSVENGDLGETELAEIARECNLEIAKVYNFPSKSRSSGLTGPEILRVIYYCSRYFDYRLLGERSAEALLRFLFWYQRSNRVSDAELSRLTRLSPETFRKWRVGEAEPDLLPVLSCLDALDLHLVPVPKGDTKKFLAAGYRKSENGRRVCISDFWSELTSADIGGLKRYAHAFNDLTAVLRGRWR